MLTKVAAGCVMLLTLALVSSCASAADFKPIAQGRSLTMHGDIVLGDAERLYQAYVRSCTRHHHCPERLFLNSNGGSVLEAYVIADWVIQIRNKGYRFDMVVGAADTCMSACFVVFASGSKRVVFPTSYIGVHAVSMHNTQGGWEENGITSSITLEQARWLKQVGCPETVIAKLITTGPGDIAWLTSYDNYNDWFEVLPPKGRTYVPADRNVMFW